MVISIELAGSCVCSNSRMSFRPVSAKAAPRQGLPCVSQNKFRFTLAIMTASAVMRLLSRDAVMTVFFAAAVDLMNYLPLKTLLKTGTLVT